MLRQRGAQQPRRSIAERFHNEVTAWVILAFSLLITVLGWKIASDYVEHRAEDRFQFELQDARDRIVERMRNYEQVLRGGIALFKTSEQPISRAQWREYVKTLQLRTYFPGIQGMGFALMLTPEALPAHIEAVRREGFPDYGVYPAGERE